MSRFKDWFSKLRELSADGYGSVTETQVHGPVEKLTNINHVAGNIYITSDQNVSDIALDELISILELRKDSILGLMDKTQNQRVSSFNIHHPREEVISHLETVRSLFLDLHERNIAALGSGQLMLSHELTCQIHALLWVQEHDTFWAEFADRDGIAYCFGSPDSEEALQLRDHFEARCSHYTALYPLSFPKTFVDPAASKEFSTLSKEFTRRTLTNRLRGIHEHLLEGDALNLKRYKKRQHERASRDAAERRIEAERRVKQEESARKWREEDERANEEAKKRGVMAAEMTKDICTYWVVCPYCGERFSIKHSVSWDGEKHIKCRTRLKLFSKKDLIR